MSVARTTTDEQETAVIGELDEVVLLKGIDGWGIGTTGTVVAVSSAQVTIEILGYLGESLDFIEAPLDRVRLIETCPLSGSDLARRRAVAKTVERQTPSPIRELDVVALRTAIDSWPAGTTGTVVRDDRGSRLVAISNHLGEDLAFLDVAPDVLKVVWRTARGNDRG